VSSVVTLSASGLVGFRFRGMIRKRNNMWSISLRIILFSW
jgi:hypothetical protein